LYIFSFLNFRFAFCVKMFFTDQNANIIKPGEITFFQIFSSVMGYRKQHRVAGDTVITESKQNIPWKGNCLYFHSRKFRFAFCLQIFFTDQNANIINPSEITFFQIFSSVMGYRKQHRVAGDTVIT